MPILNPYKPTKLKPRIDFGIDRLRIFLETNGLPVIWEMASECPCVEPVEDFGVPDNGNLTDVGESNPDCEVCKGRGYLFHSEQEIVAQITSADSNPDRFSDYGELAEGMISLTTFPEHRLNLGDRITLKTSVMRTRETHKYTTYSLEPESQTRYPIKLRELDLESGPITLGVLDLHVAGADGVATAAGKKIEGVDFTVTEEGKIAWINPPEVDGFWSISYYATPRYLVHRLPHPYRDTRVKVKRPTVRFTSLPINAHCKLEFLASGRF